MNIIQQYIDYLKDNPQKLWFKNKLYGWGWTPATWQGWLVLAIFLAMIIMDATNFIKVVLDVIVLLLICYKTGETPKWQWGMPKK